MFVDRDQAGKLLADKVADQLSKLPPPEAGVIIVGLPRGGVPVAREVALHLAAPLTLLVSKKIGAPGEPELAIGAVSSTGIVVLNEELGPYIDLQQRYIEQQVRELSEKTRSLEQTWLKAAGLDPTTLLGKRVIIVDDGVATGMTTEAALRSAKALGAAEIILATPIIGSQAKAKLERECNLVVALLTPLHFFGIGAFYIDFHQVSDLEVIDALKEVALSQRQSTAPSLL